MKIQRYGWLPDHPDHRDLKYAAPKAILEALPTSVDLRPKMPSVYDQGQLGSCTGNAIAGACHYVDIKEGDKTITAPSRLFIYYYERVLEGTVKYDAGANIRDGMKVLNKYGYPDESLWPYNIKKFATKPTVKAINAAKKEMAAKYQRIAQDANSIKSCLAEKFPVVIGFSVYESFESQKVADTGIMPMPKTNEELLGGHAVLVVGYDDAKKWWIVRNSWGVGWGDKGYFYMPYQYLLDSDLSSDFWTVRYVPM